MTARGLLSKLADDLERMRAKPWAMEPAVDYFATAEHIGDHPRTETDQRTSEYRHRNRTDDGKAHNGHKLLLTACWLANAAKHGEPWDEPGRDPLTVADLQGGFDRMGFAPGFDLGGQAAKRRDSGDAPTLLTTVARDVLDFWREELGDD